MHESSTEDERREGPPAEATEGQARSDAPPAEGRPENGPPDGDAAAQASAPDPTPAEPEAAELPVDAGAQPAPAPEQPDPPAERGMEPVASEMAGGESPPEEPAAGEEPAPRPEAAAGRDEPALPPGPVAETGPEVPEADGPIPPAVPEAAPTPLPGDPSPAGAPPGEATQAESSSSEDPDRPVATEPPSAPPALEAAPPGVEQPPTPESPATEPPGLADGAPTLEQAAPSDTADTAEGAPPPDGEGDQPSRQRRRRRRRPRGERRETDGQAQAGENGAGPDAPQVDGDAPAPPEPAAERPPRDQRRGERQRGERERPGRDRPRRDRPQRPEPQELRIRPEDQARHDRIAEILTRVAARSDQRIAVLMALTDERSPSPFRVLADQNMNFAAGAGIRHISDYIAARLRAQRIDRGAREGIFLPLRELGIVEPVAVATREELEAGQEPVARGVEKPQGTPGAAWALNPEVAKLLKTSTANDRRWRRALEEWIGANDERRVRAAQQSAGERAAGGSPQDLLRAAARQLQRGMLAGFELVWVDDDQEEIGDEARERLESVGLLPLPEPRRPGAMLAGREGQRVWFIEAGTGSGEIDTLRKAELSDWLSERGWNAAGFTTVYASWRDAARRQGQMRNLAIGGSIWIAEDGGRLFDVKSLAG